MMILQKRKQDTGQWSRTQQG